MRALSASLVFPVLMAAAFAPDLHCESKNHQKQARSQGDGGADTDRTASAESHQAPVSQQMRPGGNRPGSATFQGKAQPVSGSAYVSTYLDLAAEYARSGSLPEAAAALEAAAARAGAEAPGLYREAAELRERGAEYGQALLDYRAMMALSGQPGPDMASLERHLAYLSLALGTGPELQPAPPVGLPKAEPLTKPGSSQAGIMIPGGIPMLAVVAEMDDSQLRDEEGLARLFSAVLQAGPSGSSKLEENPLRNALVSHIRSYEELLRHMRKCALLPAGFDRTAGHKLIFPMAGNKQTIKRTARFLSFFGVRYRYTETKDGRIDVELTLSQSKKFDSRRRLLRHLGIDLQDRDLREITVTPRDDELAVMFGVDTWDRQILRGSGKESSPLLERLLLSPRSMLLYTALASCSESARAALLSQVSPGELLSVADSVAGLGRHLDVRGGKLVFPGANEAWEALLGPGQNSAGEPLARLFRLDNGGALVLYAGLASAPREVQEYLTATPDRLHQTNRALMSNKREPSVGAAVGMRSQNIGRLLRQLRATPDRLVLDLDSRFREYLFPGSKQGTSEEARAAIHVEPQDIPYLARSGDVSIQTHSLTEVVEFLTCLHRSGAEAWSRETIDALMSDAPRAPVLIDILGNIDPGPELLARYLTYCRNLARSRNQGWNVNRIRTSQSLFYLLSLLRREEALGGDDARLLLAAALNRMERDTEAEFAAGIAGLLSDELIPRLVRAGAAATGSGDVVLRALAGNEPRRQFSYEGRRFVFDAAGQKMDRMRGALLHQRFTPLPALLAIYRILGDLRQGRGEARALWADLAAGLEEVRTAELAPNAPKFLRQASAWTDIDALKRMIPQGTQAGGLPAARKKTAQDLESSLHVELGVTLLALCYAYHGSPEVDALAFDVNLIRKHDFTESRANTNSWNSARLETRSDLGNYFAGSISGIDYELARLEVAQSRAAITGRESVLAPTLLAGLRAVPDSLRSDRAQEYVALTVRLGREILALASLDPEQWEWCDSVLRLFVPPRRREEAASLLRRSKVAAAAGLFSPSEFFFLGEAYRRNAERERTAAGNTPRQAGTFRGPEGPDSQAGRQSPRSPIAAGPAPPALTRLEEIRGQTDRAAAAALVKEVEQYGVPLRWQLGLRRFTMDLPQPYEYLEQDLREQLLFERMCDLKIHLAELHYALGLPAFLAQADEEPALREVLSRSPDAGSSDWQSTLRRMARLGKDSVRGWIEEALNRGTISLAEEKEAAPPAPARN